MKNKLPQIETTSHKLQINYLQAACQQVYFMCECVIAFDFDADSGVVRVPTNELGLS